MKPLYRSVEPFVFGKNGVILTKEDARKVLKDNSYYFFVAGFMLLVAFILIAISGRKISSSAISIPLFGIFWLAIGYSIRKFGSRIASLLALITCCNVILTRAWEGDIGGLFFLSFIFLAASYRSTKASFVYQKK